MSLHYPPHPFAASKLQAATKAWIEARTANWRNVTASTLLLRRHLFDGINTRYLDENECRKAFRFFLKLVNKRVFKGLNGARDMQVNVIAVVEKTGGAGWHIHAAFERPTGWSPSDFENLIRRCWKKIQWGEKVGKIESSANCGWFDYMVKNWQKAHFECLFDSIDLDSLKTH